MVRSNKQNDACEVDVRQMSQKYWPQRVTAADVNADLIDNIYTDYLRGCSDSKRFLAFEISHFLEHYLWPTFDPSTSSKSHVLSIILMVNTKFIERVPAWQAFEDLPDQFPALFSRVSHMLLQEDIGIRDRISLIIFWSHAIASIERDLVRKEVQKYIALPIWISLSAKRRETEFASAPKLKKIWARIEKNDQKRDPQELEAVIFERKALVSMIRVFFTILDSIPGMDEVPSLELKQLHQIAFVERFLQLLVDIESLLPTRRWFNALLDDMHVVVSCRKSALFHRPVEGRLFSQLLDMLIFYARFEIDDLTGDALTDKEMAARHYDRVFGLQKIVFKDYPEEMRKFYMSNIAAVDAREEIIKHFDQLSLEQLTRLCVKIGIIEEDSKSVEKKILQEMLAFVYEKYTSQLQSMNQMPLYPTENIIWDENVVPQQFFGGDQCLALPKLNLQFLTLHDYLLRNFHLFRLESTYEIRQDIEDAVFRMKPWKREDGAVLFGGWARMALQIQSFAIVEVKKPLIGEKHPSRVRAEIRVNLNVRREVKREWEKLRKHDVCFLVALKPPAAPGTFFKYNEPFIPQVGLEHVRGCEIEGMLDPAGRLIDEMSNEKLVFDTDYRTYRVWLDCNQFGEDAETSNQTGVDEFYEGFNLIIRRKPEENNFKAVLETIRDLMNARCVVPDWLHDVILGFGDPAAAHYSNLDFALTSLDFNDTFLDFDHLKSSFPGCEVKCDASSPSPPFRIEFEGKDKLSVQPYVIPNRGPYPFAQPKSNSIRFTPTQVEAIKSGVQPGLTVIVGPPGTGKTDVAVQIINNIYHNFPDQRTLIVTHSNQALNQLFEKIMKLDVDERHLLRLGHGEEALETEKDFTRYGRVNYVLKKRLELLQAVQQLAISLKLPPDAGHTCETASYFFLYHVFSRWEEFMSRLSSSSSPAEVANLFPFAQYFSDAPQPLFKGISFEEDLEISRGCYRHIKKIFTQLDEFKAFEMLRTGAERSRYLLIREAKVIAMTCTHAALKRKELVELGFQYDNILMEEAAQILEIETFIPLLLQTPEHGHNRLKRWIMIGDHHQLPPVVKNMAFQKFCNMEQSLFSRFVRLGVPTVDLDAQGRARASLCDLYRWRYKNLGDLQHVQQEAEYQTANAGFIHDYQLIDVADFNGVGESEPVPHFYQNLAEAEFVVATFMYMRLLGYPAEKITILTTYNGQKSLLRDVVVQRCATNPFIGEPHKITTVDKFQGQQNDYILLSLVRTKHVGHIRDVRRLVVALSRARLGLYVFARVPLFSRCYELAPAFKQLLKRPQTLQLVPSEEFGAARGTRDQIESGKSISLMSEMVEFVYQFYGQKTAEWQKTRPEMIKSVLNPAQEPMEQESDKDAEAEKAPEVETVDDEEELGFEPLNEEDQGEKDPEAELMDQDFE